MGERRAAVEERNCWKPDLPKCIHNKVQEGRKEGALAEIDYMKILVDKTKHVCIVSNINYAKKSEGLN